MIPEPYAPFGSAAGLAGRPRGRLEPGKPVDPLHRVSIVKTGEIRAEFAAAHAAVAERAVEFQAAIDALCAQLPADDLHAASDLAHMERQP